MNQIDKKTLTADEWDEVNFLRAERTDFDRVIDRARSRRGFPRGVMAYGSAAAVMSTGLLSARGALASSVSRFPFTQIDAQTDFNVHVPEG